MSSAVPTGALLSAALAAVVVADDHVVLPADLGSPVVVVSFEGQYVWSFVAERDGSRLRSGWLVPWPEVLRARLEGTARVRLGDPAGEVTWFDEPVSFGGGTEPLELQDRHGHPLAVDKAGHLTRVFSETGSDVRRHIAEGTARAIADLRDHVGIDAHVSYGCLLGAVREGRMIGHDSDSDLAYVSTHTSPADIVLESFRIEREMRELGWKVVRMSGADLKLFLPLPDGRTVHVDVFGGFYVSGVFYLMGGRSGSLPRAALTPVSTVTLEGVELAAPADPETVLAFLYGPGWRVPDPAFQPVDPEEGLRRLDGWMRGFRTDLPDWNDLIRSRRSDIPRTRSWFAVWARKRMPEDAVVVDLGSGTGRDSVWFARNGHRVVALDFSGLALRITRQRLLRQGVTDPDTRVIVLNDVRTTLLAGAELAREPVPPHLYARGLVGCLDEDARHNLWGLCSMALRRGGALYLELSAAGKGLGPTSEEGLVRRLDVDDLVREITAAGGRVVTRTQGPGKDFFDQPDPLIARLEVRWSPPASPALTSETTPDREAGTAPTQGEPMATSSTRPREALRKAMTLPQRARDLNRAVQENRRLNRRIAELTDVVTELLVPLADRDEAKAQELLATYRRTTLAP